VGRGATDEGGARWGTGGHLRGRGAGPAEVSGAQAARAREGGGSG
jgi:hypothetical protein